MWSTPMLTTTTIYCKLPNKLFSKLALLLHAVHHWSLHRDQWCSQCYNRPIHKISSLAERTWKTKLFDLTFEPLYCQVSYHAPRPTKNFATLDRSMTYTPSKQYQWVSQNIDDHILLSFLLYWWMKKCFYISVSWKQNYYNQTLPLCAFHILNSHLSLFMNVNFIRHRRMLSHLCCIRVLWFPLKPRPEYYLNVQSCIFFFFFFLQIDMRAENWLKINFILTKNFFFALLQEYCLFGLAKSTDNGICLRLVWTQA